MWNWLRSRPTLAGYLAGLVAFTAWLWGPPLLLALGIDWSQVDDGDRLNAFVALCLGVVGIVLSIRTALLARVQHRLLEIEQSKRVDLQMVCKLNSEMGTDDKRHIYQQCAVSIFNGGNRPAKDVFWILFTPDLDRNEMHTWVEGPNELVKETGAWSERGTMLRVLEHYCPVIGPRDPRN